jgi:outer membrane protein assembly factor BamB
VIEGRVAIAVGQDAVYGIDLASGKQEWTLDRNGGPVSMPAVGTVGGGTVLVFLDEAPGNEMSIVGVDLRTLRERWRTPLRAVAVAGVTIDGTTAFTGDVEGMVYAFDLATGHLRWSKETGNRIDGPPAVDGARVYVAVRDATDRTVTVVALNASNGEKVWSYAPPVGSATATIPTADQGVVMVASGDRIVRGFSPERGDVRWTAVTQSLFSPASGGALRGSLALVADASGGLYRVDPEEGGLVWDHQLNELIVRSSPVLSNSAVLIGLNDGRLVAIDEGSGALVWQSAASPGLIGAIAVASQLIVAVKGGSEPGLVAFEHDPNGTLLDVPSPTVPQPGRLVVSFAIAFLACLVVLWLPSRALRLRIERGSNGDDEDGAGADDGEPAT